MPRPLQNTEDRIEREVRRRLSEQMVSAGVPQSRIDLEIMFLLPEGFVRQYVRLYSEAFVDDQQSTLSGSGDDEGRVLKKVKNNPTRKMYRGSQVKGGKWVGRKSPIKGTLGELAMNAKTRVDKRIQRVISQELELLDAQRQAHRAGIPIPEERVGRCGECGKFL